MWFAWCFSHGDIVFFHKLNPVIFLMIIWNTGPILCYNKTIWCSRTVAIIFPLLSRICSFVLRITYSFYIVQQVVFFILYFVLFFFFIFDFWRLFFFARVCKTYWGGSILWESGHKCPSAVGVCKSTIGYWGDSGKDEWLPIKCKYCLVLSHTFAFSPHYLPWNSSS